MVFKLATTAPLLLAALAAASPLRRQTDACGQTFDYVIVGGGLAGLTLANRLTAGSSSSVLVLEAGGDPFQLDRNVSVPALIESLTKTQLDYNLTVVPTDFTGGETKPFTQGRGLGGGSSINYMAYARGASEVYDAWANEYNNPGWDWNSVLPYFAKSVTLNPPPSEQASNIVYDASVYGNGPVQLSWPNYVEPLEPYFANAFAETGLNNIDASSGTGIGYTYYPQSIIPSTETRSGASNSFYDASAQARGNLVVSQYSVAQKVLFDGTTATGVQYTDSNGNTCTANANSEVILSTGGIHTPQLLMVSGVGPASQLSSFGIEQVVDNENVGTNLQDHILFGMFFDSYPNITSSAQFKWNDTLFDELLDEWQNEQQGEFTNTLGGAMAFDQVPDSVTANAPYQASLPSNWAHVLYIMTTFGKNPTKPNTVSTSVVLLSPESRGTVTLQSASMNDPPVLDPNWFGTEGDKQVGIWAYKNLRNITNGPAFAGAIIDEQFPGPSVSNDDDDAIFKAMGEGCSTISHPVGTAAMKPQDQGGVVDSQLRVYGTSKLRIVDASIMPIIPAAQVQSVVYMIAEKAADLILNPPTYSS